MLQKPVGSFWPLNSAKLETFAAMRLLGASIYPCSVLS